MSVKIYIGRPRWHALLPMISVAVLSGCATGYHQQMSGAMQSTAAGSIDLALSELEKNNDSKDKSLLYFFEKGELLRMKGAVAESRDAWLVADGVVRQWEEDVKADPSKVLGDIGSFIVNDTTRRYDGRDYEKVLLSVRLALNHLAMGDWDSARVEIKKMHEREAVIADFRSKEVEAAKNGAAEKGLKATSFKELSGYPVETLTAPEVLALKNAYESAIANYLAGFIYEAQGEMSLAAAGYRKAIEIGGSNSVLDEGLKGLDRRMGLARGKVASVVDTLFIIESGTAPVIRSKTLPIPLPIPSKSGLQVVFTPISWPVVEPGGPTYVPGLRVGGQSVSPSTITSVDHMARRALSDEMPGIIFRSSVRAIAKGAAQKVVQDNAASMGPVGSLLSLATSITAVATESADERIWRSLPDSFSVSRVSLPAGSHQIVLDSPAGPITKEVQLSGKHAVVTLRSIGNSVFVTQTPYAPGTPAPVVAVNQTRPILDAERPVSKVQPAALKSRAGKKRGGAAEQ